MPDIIQLLPESLANQIAAGEVIQRPASVVKELIENAVDAHATVIKLIIKDSGKTLIQVIDNGEGMSETDARMSFERHATSKIKTTDDLFKINTKGFRGEALASIAAVAKVELKTRQAHQELGVMLRVEDSKVVKQEACQASQGSNFSVRHLFYNVPARRKFLKSDPVELRHILDEFIKVALAHSDITFICHHNDNNVYQLPAGPLRQRITNIFGKGTNEKIIPVEEVTDFISISGFTGRPDYAKKSKGDQFFFVNNRYIKSHYLSHAVKAAYQEILPEKHFPFFVLYIKIEPSEVDINVHPAKQEVKFENDRLIYNYVKVAVKHALGKYSITPSIDFDQNVNYNLAASNINRSSGGSGAASTFQNTRQQGPNQKEVSAWQNEYKELLGNENQEAHHPVVFSSKINTEDDLGFVDAPRFRAPIQIDKRFLVTQIKSGLMVIDQQAAHQRIIYERQLTMLHHAEVATQTELFPQTIELDPASLEVFNSILVKMNMLGFDIEGFGQNSFIIRGLPAHINQKNINAAELVRVFLENFINHTDPDLGIDENLCLALARSQAVKRGVIMQKEEMEDLIDQLFACEMPYKSPTGRKCFITISLNDLDNRFMAK